MACTSCLLAGATGIEPAISGLTGRRVNHYTTPPRSEGIVSEIPQSVNHILGENFHNLQIGGLPFVRQQIGYCYPGFLDSHAIFP